MTPDSGSREQHVLRFESDYMEGAHPAILERLQETNFNQTSGYGSDEYCEHARELIRAACECELADVRFLVGGTQANATVIDALLAPWQGVISIDEGHISVHEAGAVEASGHKVLCVSGQSGKLSADTVREFCQAFFADANHEHEVEPGAVYISHPSEYGTLYTEAELRDLRRVCDEFRLRLFLDGARLGYGLAALDTDVTLPVIARTCDAFTIGGTKVGALFGEAVVFPDPSAVSHFLTQTKRHGGLLAKGRLLGIQFEVLFTDGRYMEISRHAIEAALRVRDAVRQAGFDQYIDSPTNQQFIVVDPKQRAWLQERVACGFMLDLPDGRSVLRFATSWATRDADVDALLDTIAKIPR